MNFLDVGGAVHLQYGSAFVGVGFNPSVSDHEAEELASAYPESTFFKVQAHVIFAEFPKDFFQVHHMLGYALRLDNHVFHIYINVSSDLLFKDSVHQSLVCSASIF